MSAVANIEPGRSVSPAQAFRNELDRMGEQFAAALPSHIKPEKFQRVVMTAVLSDPAIMSADRKSLMESAIRAAQDGLLPDKREGAFVVFNTKVNGNWVKAVQWMPMIGGVIKRIHQSGEVATITAKVVFGGDTFRSWIDDQGEHVAYEQAELPDYDTIRQVFAMAKMKDGSIYVETLTPRDIEKIRSVSRSKDSGPWATWWEEMAKKSAIRRLSKRLPLSTDLHDLISRDDALYDLSRAPEPRPSLASRLSIGSAHSGGVREGFTSLAQGDDEGALDGDKETEDDPAGLGEEITGNPMQDKGSSPAGGEDENQSQAEQIDPADERDEPAISPAEVEKLTRYARDMLGHATADVDAGLRKDRMTKGQTTWRGDLDQMSSEAMEIAPLIFSAAKTVAKGDQGAGAAATYVAGLLGCEPDAVWSAG